MANAPTHVDLGVLLLLRCPPYDADCFGNLDGFVKLSGLCLMLTLNRARKHGTQAWLDDGALAVLLYLLLHLLKSRHIETLFPPKEAAMKSFLIALFVLLPFVLLPTPLFAESPDNRVAIADLKSVDIICDVNVGKPDLLLTRLELIDETYSQLLDARVTPTIVVAFRGEASRYITRDSLHVPPQQMGTKKAIRQILEQFQRNGIRLEQCAIAARARHIDPDDLLPGIALVQNGYVSIVAYQTRGYALLPMD